VQLFRGINRLSARFGCHDTKPERGSISKDLLAERLARLEPIMSIFNDSTKVVDASVG
jgi:hypothetical protein